MLVPRLHSQRFQCNWFGGRAPASVFVEATPGDSPGQPGLRAPSQRHSATCLVPVTRCGVSGPCHGPKLVTLSWESSLPAPVMAREPSGVTVL